MFYFSAIVQQRHQTIVAFRKLRFHFFWFMKITLDFFKEFRVKSVRVYSRNRGFVFIIQ